MGKLDPTMIPRSQPLEKWVGLTFDYLLQCAGGDVFNVLRDVDLTDEEIDCLFKQLVQGVHYLHSSGVAHRDIKPENLVLTATGTLKIIDFGVADVVQSSFEKESRKSAGYVGSEPFLSPEVFTDEIYDGKALDVWSTAITWYGMQFRALPFDKAKKEDAFYVEYLAARRQRNWPPLVRCNPQERECLYGMFDPDPTRRWTIEKVLNCTWLQGIEVCQYAHTASGAEHHHYIKALDKKP
jgi:serine/threonine protein kinase